LKTPQRHPKYPLSAYPLYLGRCSEALGNQFYHTTPQELNGLQNHNLSSPPVPAQFHQRELQNCSHVLLLRQTACTRSSVLQNIHTGYAREARQLDQI